MAQTAIIVAQAVGIVAFLRWKKSAMTGLPFIQSGLTELAASLAI